MSTRPSAALLDALRMVAPGSPLREGVDRVLQGSMGALIVVGDGPEVLALCSGGFLFDAEFTPQRLSELAKMDGAIILAPDCSRVARANVHLVPDPDIPTAETGTRHRTAERVARQIDVPVISVSEDLSVVSIYRNNEKRTLEPIPRVLARANQALQTLERYKERLDVVSGALSALEVEDLVTVRDAASVVQRFEMVRRIAEEIEGCIVELGVDGRLILLQLEELIGGVDQDRELVVKDYASASSQGADAVVDRLAALSTDELVDLGRIVEIMELPGNGSMDAPLQSPGYRLLHKVPRLPDAVADKVIARFGNLQKIMRASIQDLDEVEGVGETRARAIKDGLSRLAETSILDRYV